METKFVQIPLIDIPIAIEEALASVKVDEETGAVIGGQYLDMVCESAEEKLVRTAQFIRTRKAQIEAMENAKKEIDARIKTAKRSVEWLQDRVLEGMTALGEKKIESPFIAMSVRDNPYHVTVTDETLIPQEFFDTKSVTTLNKTRLKDAMQKDGLVVNGARLERGQSITIK